VRFWNRPLVQAAGGAVAIFIAALAVWFALEPKEKVTPQPNVATARVTADESAILTDPLDSDTVVVKLKKGDKVNVLRAPHSATQDWTQVQYIAPGRVYPAGVMNTADLGNWSSSDPDVALLLVEMYAPAEGAEETELRQYAQRLSAFIQIQRFAGTPQQARAQAELDKINASLQGLGAGTPDAPARSPSPSNPPRGRKARPTAGTQ